MVLRLIHSAYHPHYQSGLSSYGTDLMHQLLQKSLSNTLIPQANNQIFFRIFSTVLAPTIAVHWESEIIDTKKQVWLSSSVLQFQK